METSGDKLVIKEQGAETVNVASIGFAFRPVAQTKYVFRREQPQEPAESTSKIRR